MQMLHIINYVLFRCHCKKIMFNDNKGRGKELYTNFSDSKDKCIALLKCEISFDSQDLKIFCNKQKLQIKLAA